MTALLRLLALIALLLMPFGMAAAPAASAVQHNTAAAMPAGHCPDQQPEDDSKRISSDCAMPCSAALPATDLTPVGSQADWRPPIEPSVEHALRGIHHEIATPPPKLT